MRRFVVLVVATTDSFSLACLVLILRLSRFEFSSSDEAGVEECFFSGTTPSDFSVVGNTLATDGGGGGGGGSCVEKANSWGRLVCTIS